jgi:hypothetical protein
LIDRTFACTTSVKAGARQLKLRAQSGTRDAEKPDRWKSLASVEVGTPGADPTLPGYYLLRLSTGRGGVSDPQFAGADGGLEVSPKRCKPTRARVALSTKGLIGGAASPLSDDYECFAAPPMLLLRVRASFRASTRLKTNRFGFLGTTAGPTEAAFAMRTRAGAAIVYGSVTDSGKARLFFRGNCTRD